MSHEAPQTPRERLQQDLLGTPRNRDVAETEAPITPRSSSRYQQGGFIALPGAGSAGAGGLPSASSAPPAVGRPNAASSGAQIAFVPYPGWPSRIWNGSAVCAAALLHFDHIAHHPRRYTSMLFSVAFYELVARGCVRVVRRQVVVKQGQPARPVVAMVKGPSAVPNGLAALQEVMRLAERLGEKKGSVYWHVVDEAQCLQRGEIPLAELARACVSGKRIFKFVLAELNGVGYTTSGVRKSGVWIFKKHVQLTGNGLQSFSDVTAWLTTCAKEAEGADPERVRALLWAASSCALLSQPLLHRVLDGAFLHGQLRLPAPVPFHGLVEAPAFMALPALYKSTTAVVGKKERNLQPDFAIFARYGFALDPRNETSGAIYRPQSGPVGAPPPPGAAGVGFGGEHYAETGPDGEAKEEEEADGSVSSDDDD
eukprot:tig00022075_g23649.t1